MRLLIDFKNLPWERTPSAGVFVYPVEEVGYGEIPEFTMHAVRVDAKCEIGLHYHDREPGWSEFLIFQSCSRFEFQLGEQIVEYSGTVSKRIRAGDVYRIRNKSVEPLYFFSAMLPGFSGFGEIVHV